MKESAYAGQDFAPSVNTKHFHSQHTGSNPSYTVDQVRPGRRRGHSVLLSSQSSISLIVFNHVFDLFFCSPYISSPISFLPLLLFTPLTPQNQNRPRAQRDPTKPFGDGSTNMPVPVAVTVPVPVRMSHDRSPRGGTGTDMGMGTGTSNIRISPSYEEALGGPEGYVKSSRINDGAGSSASNDVTDDTRTYSTSNRISNSNSNSNSNSTYEGVRTRRDDDTAATAPYISNRKNIEQKHDKSTEKDTPESEKVLKLYELNTEEMISKSVTNTQNQNVETDSRRLHSKVSGAVEDLDLAVLERIDKFHGVTDIQNRPEVFRKEVQVEVNDLMEVREGLKDVESTNPVIEIRGDGLVYNDYERQRERGTKANEKMNVEVEKKRNEEFNSIQKEKEEERMIEEREEEKEQLREKDRERDRAREKEEEKEKDISDWRSREEEKEQLRERDRERNRAREKEEAKEKEISDRRTREEEKEQLRES